MTILKFELIHIKSLQEVTDSNILLLNFGVSIIFWQNSHDILLWIWKHLFIFMFGKLKCVPKSEKFLLPHHMPSCHFDTPSLEVSDFWFPNYHLPRREVGIWNSATDLSKFQIQNKTFTFKLCSKFERIFKNVLFMFCFYCRIVSENYYSTV